MTDINRAIICTIIQYLKAQLNSSNVNDESKEALAIGIQCLETAYDMADRSSAECKYDLEEIFEKYINSQAYDIEDDANEKKTVAEILKNEGNSQMSCNNIKEAISSYSRAIELNPKNAVYYCNRAAALNSFGHYDTAIEDCRSALKYNPLYHKAYARMGVAFKAKNQLKEARDSFKKALELQPENENYKVQLKDIEHALRNSPDYMINLEINGTRFPVMNVENNLANIVNMASSIFRDRNSL